MFLFYFVSSHTTLQIFGPCPTRATDFLSFLQQNGTYGIHTYIYIFIYYVHLSFQVPTRPETEYFIKTLEYNAYYYYRHRNLIDFFLVNKRAPWCNL